MSQCSRYKNFDHWPGQRTSVDGVDAYDDYDDNNDNDNNNNHRNKNNGNHEVIQLMGW